MQAILAVLLLGSFSVYAQDANVIQATRPEFKATQDDQLHVWVEVHIPISRNNGFEDALEDSATKSNGRFGITGGWEPLRKSTSKNVWKRLLRNGGVTLNYTENFSDHFVIPVYQTVRVLQPWEEQTQCYNTKYRQCDYCTITSVGLFQKCVFESVYGRESYIKYSERSIAIGGYFPVAEARRLTVQAGVNMRLHFVKEGFLSNELENSHELTTGAVLRVGVPVYKNISVTGGVEQSFWGTKTGDNKRYKYRAYTVGVSARW